MEARKEEGKWLPGIAGQAVNMTGSRILMVPIGNKVGEKQYERLDFRQGTIEMWFQPNWTSTMLPNDLGQRLIFAGATPLTVTYEHMASATPGGRELMHYFHALKGVAMGAPSGYPIQRIFYSLPLNAGEWHHLAVCWEEDPERGWLSEIYVDGQGSTGEGRFGAHSPDGLRHWQEGDRAYKPFALRPEAYAHPHPTLWLMGAIDAAVDEVRVSDVARYHKPFKPLERGAFEADEHTLMLLRFDGDMSVITPGGAELVHVQERN